MPPRIHLCSSCLRPLPLPRRLTLCKLLSTATVTTPAPLVQQHPPPMTLYPPTQPPSHRRPEERKSQLHRQYTSLLRSTPLLLLFQHNNLKATEWMSIRRELSHAMHKVDTDTNTTQDQPPLAQGVKMQIIQTRIFESALLVVEHFHPPPPQASSSSSSSSSPSSIFTHALSRSAHDAVAAHKLSHALHPLLCGPLAVVSFPVVSPAHLKAALSILAPKPPLFAAPSRRANPGYHDPSVQAGLQKLLLLGVRVEGRVFDTEGARRVGAIEGGIKGLRAQLVGLLGAVGAGVTAVLEGQARNLYVTLEGRREMLQEEKEEAGKGVEKEI